MYCNLHSGSCCVPTTEVLLWNQCLLLWSHQVWTPDPSDCTRKKARGVWGPDLVTPALAVINALSVYVSFNISNDKYKTQPKFVSLGCVLLHVEKQQQQHQTKIPTWKLHYYSIGVNSWMLQRCNCPPFFSARVKFFHSATIDPLRSFATNCKDLSIPDA